MQIQVSGHQVAVTAPLRDYVIGKFTRIVRHFEHLHGVTVTLSLEKLLHKADATLHCAANKTIYADRAHSYQDLVDSYGWRGQFPDPQFARLVDHQCLHFPISFASQRRRMPRTTAMNTFRLQNAHGSLHR